MKLDVLNIEGSSTGRQVDLPEDIFGIEPNEHAVWLAVKQYRGNQRQGTHKTKERNEIVGSRKKIKKQKGTGTARAGDIKNPLFRGGGRIFGPRPRKYSIRVNKKVKRLAKRSALSSYAAEGRIKVLEDFTLEGPRTNDFRNIISNLDVDGKTLLVTAGNEPNIYVSSRNVVGTDVVNAKDVNVYQIMNAKCVILSEGAIDILKEVTL